MREGRKQGSRKKGQERCLGKVRGKSGKKEDVGGEKEGNREVGKRYRKGEEEIRKGGRCR